MKKILILSVLSISISCTSQKNSVTNANPTEYLKTITADDLKNHLSIIASDAMQGRETGSKGQKKAGEYLIKQYTANGISYPSGATDFYQNIPASFFSELSKEKLEASENIWAFVEGSEKPNEIIVVSAHYDHIGIKNGTIYNGADDDGSGTVALLEIAQAFAKAKKVGHGPKRSILFLHVTGEEHGLLGSNYYCQHPLFPLSNTITNINIDMIGRHDEFHTASSNYVYLIGSDYLSTDLYSICEEVNKKYVNIALDYKYNNKTDPNRYYYRSDHYNFAKNGIPSVFLFNGVHADYHKPTDTVDKIEFDALKKRTQLAFVIAWELANRENRPEVDKRGS